MPASKAGPFPMMTDSRKQLTALLSGARLADPTPALLALCFSVGWDRAGIHASVFNGDGDEAYRLTRRRKLCPRAGRAERRF